MASTLWLDRYAYIYVHIWPDIGIGIGQRQRQRQRVGQRLQLFSCCCCVWACASVIQVLGISSSAAHKCVCVCVFVRTKARVIDELPLWLMDLLLSSIRSDTIEKPRSISITADNQRYENTISQTRWSSAKISINWQHKWRIERRVWRNARYSTN